jgi:hypothetical protein
MRQKAAFRGLLGGRGLKFLLGIADAMKAYMTSITKTLPEVQIGLFTVFAAIAAKVRSMIEAQAPIGYQDEDGFHTGTKPRGEEAGFSNVW